MTDKFIAGSGGGGKFGGGGSRTPSPDPDSLNSRSFGHIIDLLGEGEIEGLADEDLLTQSQVQQIHGCVLYFLTIHL